MSRRRHRQRRFWILAVAGMLVLLGGAPSRAQTREEFWPGFEAHINLSKRTRLFLLASSVRERDPSTGGSDAREGTVGGHWDISFKPVRRKLQTADWERERYLWARVGYQYTTTLGSTDDPSREHLGLAELTVRTPLPRDFWLIIRNRVDFRESNDVYSTRPRFRLQFEREVRLFWVETVPYVNAEVFYDTRYDAVNRQQYQAGLEVLLSKHWRVEPYFTRQHDSRPQTRNLNAVGLTVKYYH